MENLKSKYYRSEPTIKFDVNQSFYDVVMNNNKNNMDYNYSRYQNHTKTYAELKNETDRLITALHRDDLKEGDVLGVCLLTVPEVDTTLLAANALGIETCWMDASAKPDSFIKTINESNMKELILFEPLKPILEQIINYTNLQRVILVSPLEFLNTPREKNTDDRFIYYSDYINLEPDMNVKHVNYDKERPSVIVQSSGSTGKSKLIVHTTYNFNSQVQKMSYSDLPFYKKKSGLVCAPPWVIYGLVTSIYSQLLFGGQTVFTLKPEEPMIYNHLGQFDYVFGVPVYYRYLYDKMLSFKNSNKEEDIQNYNRMFDYLNNVNVFISGGDKLAEEELMKWQHMFNVPIVNGYGNNEIVGAGIVSPLYANRPGSIGIPMYGNIVKTFDLETGKLLKDGEEGEIGINTDSVFKEYLGNKEETDRIKKYHDDAYWVHTGDAGYVDKDGYVYITGRTQRLIIDKLGYKISPDNIENVINRNPYVKECVVVGVEIAPNDTVPMAFIEFNEEYKNNGLLLEDIKTECISKLKEYEVPKFYEEIDKIPHKDNGGKRDFIKLNSYAKEIIDNKLKLELK